MNETASYVLLLSIIPYGLAAVHLLTKPIQKMIGAYSEYMRSFSAGFSVAYVFLLLLPELPEIEKLTTVDTAVFALLGFTLFHEVHKYILRRQDERKRKHLLDEMHLATAGLYGFLITFFLVELAKASFIQGMFVSVIIALHSVLSEISQTRIVGKDVREFSRVALLVVATLAGGFLSIFGVVNPLLTVILFSITIGALIYIVIREEIPRGEKGKPSFFVIGVLVLILLRQGLL